MFEALRSLKRQFFECVHYDDTVAATLSGEDAQAAQLADDSGYGFLRQAGDVRHVLQARDKHRTGFLRRFPRKNDEQAPDTIHGFAGSQGNRLHRAAFRSGNCAQQASGVGLEPGFQFNLSDGIGVTGVGAKELNLAAENIAGSCNAGKDGGIAVRRWVTQAYDAAPNAPTGSRAGATPRRLGTR